MPDIKGKAEELCKHCSDDDGSLKSRNDVRNGIAQWLKSWQKIDEREAMMRAEHYMKAMPAWTEKK
jgi:hypothetical protein